MHFIGECQSCHCYHIDFLLHVYSDVPIPVAYPRSSSGRNSTNEGKTNPEKIPSQNGSVYIEKVGINPPVTVKIDKQIEKFLDRESRLWYYRGVKALCENYGIGAFAYFRRIIEKELIHIVEDLVSLPSSNSANISKFVAEYSINQNQSISSICKKVYEFLPESLKSLGDNPLMLLYTQTSEGLHNLTEEQCLARAELINKILVFIIRKIYEEKSEILDIRESIKKLKGNS